MKIFNQTFFFGVLSDLLVLCGLALIFVGLDEYCPWMAKAVVGGILLVLGVLSLRG